MVGDEVDYIDSRVPDRNKFIGGGCLASKALIISDLEQEEFDNIQEIITFINCQGHYDSDF